ncbi:hypothetical protein HPULCUR_011787 [Helicostylum pulchrum]|uniref:Ubiquitin carboxyl-terminal hydrolase n=1 Tax=Helicostylum pulchrum TaxID=562976 RepID=A0ABP9YH48_9FUNG
MSTTSHNVQYKTNTIVQPTSTTAELRKRAWVNKAEIELYNIQAWVHLGDYALFCNDLENAYVSYMRGSSIMRTNLEIIPVLLRDLAVKIENWYRMSKQLNNTHFNVNPINPSTTSAASYAYRPSHDPLNFPHYTLNHNNTPPLISNPTPSSPTTAIRSSSLTNKVTDNKKTLLPNWTNNAFPNRLVTEPYELVKWLTASDNPPSILLIDVRPREIFKSGCITHKWIMQIDPIVLQRDLSKVQDSLLQNPTTEQTFFSERARFDLIVYYDQNSKILETAHAPILRLKSLLEAYQLKRPPMMLMGGFDSWLAYVGEAGVYKFSSNKENKRWFKSNNDEREHRTLYDYFAGQSCQPTTHQYLPISIPQPSLPTAPRKESLTTRYPELISPTSSNNTFPLAHLQSPQTLKQQDLRPIPPSYPKLHRRKTFIDNPFNGFTTTTSKLYDVPPMSAPNYKPSSTPTSNIPSPRPSSTESIVPINRPLTLTDYHHVSTNNIHSSPMTSSYSQSGTIVSMGTTGLKNLGNTCYMNSIIQCLSATVPLARYFTSGIFKQHINRQNNKAGTGGILTESFAELLRVMWSESYNFISPMTFRESLVRFAPRFSGTDQQDSQEFLLFLLDGLHEDLNLAAFGNQTSNKFSLVDEPAFEKLPTWQASALAWEKYLHSNSSIIVSLFQGQYRSKLTCLSCKQTSTTYSAFMSLSLPIPAKKLRITSMTLNQCLDYFVKEEVLDKEDAWKCPQCNKKRKALKQLTLTKLPDILLIHLKRFSIDGLFRNKLDTMVKCPIRSLDLSGYVPMSITPSPPQDRPSFIYDLYAVSNHYGSLTGGHYTACVRDGYTDKWNYFNDSRYSLCDENKVVTKAAYNLFYVRSKVK